MVSCDRIGNVYPVSPSPRSRWATFQLRVSILADLPQVTHLDATVGTLFWRNAISRKIPWGSMMRLITTSLPEYAFSLCRRSQDDQLDIQHFSLPTTSLSSLAISPDCDKIALWEGSLEVFLTTFTTVSLPDDIHSTRSL